MDQVQDHKATFLILLLSVTSAFGWILWQFYGALIWAVILALIFTPFYHQFLLAMPGRRNLAAVITLLLSLVVVIFPLVLISAALVHDTTAVYHEILSGSLDFGAYFRKIVNSLPSWIVGLLNRFNVGNLLALQETLSRAVVQGSQLLATQAFVIGQSTFEFLVNAGIMLYIFFFMLRDGQRLAQLIHSVLPLSTEHKRYLFTNFTAVMRATINGNIVVAATRGALSGFTFWMLGIQGPLVWGVLMAFLSLLPVIGTGLIWGPVAVYYFVTGAIWQGITLTVFGIFVLGFVDKVLRSLLVGNSKQMPDYIFLVATLGGIGIFGPIGLVIGPIVAAMFIAVWSLLSAMQESNYFGE